MPTMRCHYVPKFYMDYFLNKEIDSFGVFFKKTGEFKVMTPINTAVIGDYYIQDGDKTIEDAFADLEGRAKKILDRWIEKPCIMQEDKATIAAFLAYQCVRVPGAVAQVEETMQAAFEVLLEKNDEVLKDPALLKKSYEKFCKYCEEQGSEKISYDIFVQSMKELKVAEKTVNEKAALGESLMTAETITQELLKMKWHLYVHRGDRFFITSDHPVNSMARVGESEAIFGGGFGLENVQVAFPVTPKICLVMDRQFEVGELVSASITFVEEINKRTMHVAERFIISTYDSHRLKKEMQRYRSTIDLPKMDAAVLKERLRKGIKQKLT
jgi:hypothetical protein